MYRLVPLKYGDAFKTWWCLLFPRAMCFQMQKTYIVICKQYASFSQTVTFLLCRLGGTGYLSMKCSKYIFVTSFVVLNQHSLGTEFSWKFLQNIIHWRGYFQKGWLSKWSKRRSEKFIGFFQCCKELCWQMRGWLHKLADVELNLRRMNLSPLFEINTLCSLVCTLLLIAQVLHNTCIWMTLSTFQNIFTLAISCVLHTKVRCD